MKNIHFIINDEKSEFELWVDGECITDCFSLQSDEAELMAQLVEFAEVPCYKKLSVREVNEKIKTIDN